ncbi:hypothetical protein [uncultured Winogradskyella sp.]|uniref:hypothetical protein n=1 Tax=uncultured Winogradskyella sp. TaxID=395353 RepID=UPI00262C6E2A|nr:hypothetical protein [uncultured Winogradskyella sp.]
MKTKFSYVISTVFLCFFMQLNAQSEFFNDLNLNQKEIKAEDFTNVETGYILDDFKFFTENKPELSLIAYEEQKPEDIIFAMQMLAIGAGLGLGEDETLWCLHAAYYYKLRQFQRSALYASLGLTYNGLSIGDTTQSLVDLQLKFLMFHTISRLNEIRLIYGLLGGYGFGSEKFNSLTTDFTRITLAVIVGFQLMLSTRWSLALETNLVAHNRWTFKPESGGEFKNDFTNFLINKNNLLTLSLIFNLGKK